MILRIDRLAIELPAPGHPSPNSASAVQELLGGKFGEMSTLMNYTFQSFNFRGRNKMRPFYDLIANIAAEEYGHIELVCHTINMLLDRHDQARHRSLGDAARGRDRRPQSYHFIASGRRPCRSTRWATPGTGRTSSPAATSRWTCCTTSSWSAAPGPTRSASTRWSTTRSPARWSATCWCAAACTSSPTPRRWRLTGVEVGKLLPIPDISNKRFPEARKHEENGLHQVIYRLSPMTTRDLADLAVHIPRTVPLRVVDGPPEGGPVPVHPEEPQLTSPIGPDGLDTRDAG